MRVILEGMEEVDLVSTEEVHKKLMTGKSLILIDGLNELGGLSNQFVDQIELALSDFGFSHEGGYGNNKYILTTRKYNDPKKRLSNCNRYEILPLSDDAIDEIISKNEGCEELKQEIRKIAIELRSNPLFLDMTIKAYKRTKKIAYNWGSLFESFLDLFLSSEESRFLEGNIGIIMGEAQPALENVAYNMTASNKIQMGWSDAYGIIKAKSGFDGNQLDGLVNYLLNGRIIRKEGAFMKFMGQPLQECLTASYIKRRLDNDKLTVKQFYDSIMSDGQVGSQWYGSIFFLNNQLDMNQLLDMVRLAEKDSQLNGLGEVNIYKPTNFTGKVIFKVTNHYCNFEAQKEAFDIYDYLNKNYGLRVVFTEGGSYEIKHEMMSPNSTTRDEVSTYLLKKGDINAIEYLSINSDYPILIYGVDHMGVYEVLRKYQIKQSISPQLPTILILQENQDLQALSQQRLAEYKDDTPKDGTPLFSLFDHRKKLLVRRALDYMQNERLKMAGFYYGGGDEGRIDPEMFTDNGNIYI